MGKNFRFFLITAIFFVTYAGGGKAVEKVIYVSSNIIATNGVALTDKGNVYTWGSGEYGLLGLGWSPEERKKREKVVDDAAKQGVFFGVNPLREEYKNRLSPTMVKGKFSGKIISVGMGSSHIVVLTDLGKMYSWGNNQASQLGVGDISPYYFLAYPQEITYKFDGKVISAVVGRNHNLALTDKGKLYSWGSNGFGQLGLGDGGEYNTKFDRNSPTEIKTKFDGKIISMSAGEGSSVVVTDKAKVYIWGDNDEGILGLGINDEIIKTPQLMNLDLEGKVVATFGGGGGIFFLQTDIGKLYVWGVNTLGKLGIGEIDEELVLSPKEIKGFDSKVTNVAVGELYCLAMTDMGSIYSWGYNFAGQLGLGVGGEDTTKYVPTKIGYSFDGKIISIAAGGRSLSLAVTDKGSLYSWGSNFDGDLGLGKELNELPAIFTPTKVKF